jgi:uroporphyrinogen decarboxylase
MDFSAEPEVWSRLRRHFQVETNLHVLERLDVDCRTVSYDWEVFCRPPKPGTPAGSVQRTWARRRDESTFEDVWGARRRTITNDYGTHECLCDYPLAKANTIEELKQYAWPEPSWWDFSTFGEVVDQVNPGNEYHLRYRMGSIFETAWSLCGLDTMLLNLVLQPEWAGYLMDRVVEIHLENLRQVMRCAGDRIDMVYLYDDLAQQHGLLMSPETWRQTIAPRQARLFDLAQQLEKPVMLHSCGDIRLLIPDLAAIGVALLNPIQTSAMNMDYPQIKDVYGSLVCFHGGIDIQQFLPGATVEQVRCEVERARQILGNGGGYICAPTHHIQADTPLENILALYGLA